MNLVMDKNLHSPQDRIVARRFLVAGIVAASLFELLTTLLA
jgi:hypothetical protein